MDKSIRASRICLIVLLIIIIALAFIKKTVIFGGHVPSESMEDTLKVGDKVYCLRTWAYIGGIKRGDIIVFHPNGNKRKLYIKRVIGLPGDTLYSKNNKVYVNNKILVEKYTKGKKTFDLNKCTVPNNCYYVLGDNRTDSFDSRYLENPYISIDNIEGIAVVVNRNGSKLLKRPKY